jgi:hypothetical protein
VVALRDPQVGVRVFCFFKAGGVGGGGGEGRVTCWPETDEASTPAPMPLAAPPQPPPAQVTCPTPSSPALYELCCALHNHARALTHTCTHTPRHPLPTAPPRDVYLLLKPHRNICDFHIRTPLRFDASGAPVHAR